MRVPPQCALLEPLTAHDVGQAAGEKDHRHDKKKGIEHVASLLQTWSSTHRYGRRSTVARSRSSGRQKVARLHQNCVKIALPTVYAIGAKLGHPRSGRPASTVDRA